MPNFHDMINALRNPGDDGVPDTIYDDLAREYDTVFEGYTEKTNSLMSTISEKDSEISRLKSKNYDLLVSVGTEKESDNPADVESDKAITFDDLFTKK